MQRPGRSANDSCGYWSRWREAAKALGWHRSISVVEIGPTTNCAFCVEQISSLKTKQWATV